MSPVEDYLFERIRKGLLELRSDGSVWYFHCQRKKWYKKILNAHPESGRMRCVVHFDGKQTSVYCNRLVWMIVHKESIPDGYFVDHKDKNRLNDRPDNLQLMEIGESHSQGYHLRQDIVLEKLSRWFEWMGMYGREPELPHEISYVEVGF